MVAVWLPEHRLLYGSDLVQRMRDGSFFMPAYLLDLVWMARREGLDVDTLFAMHAGPMPWSEVLSALEERGRDER